MKLKTGVVLSYYSVIAGWACDYVIYAIRNQFDHATKAHIEDLFSQLIASPLRLLIWHTVVMAATTLVVIRGVNKGLERCILYLFPAMLVLIVILVAYATQYGEFYRGLHFLLYPDFSALSSKGFLIALGHSFFTLSIAVGSIMMYGAYVPKDISIGQAAVAIAVADTSVALLSGLAIFPIVFANGFAPEAGPGLIFKILPLAFGHMVGGYIFGIVFFVMVVFAAFTSAISLMEPSVGWAMDTWQLNRRQAAILMGSGIWLLGLVTVFSFNLWSQVKIFGMGLFENLDYLTANIMLPLGGLLLSLFTGWQMRKSDLVDELALKSPIVFAIWRFILRYVAPLGILIIFLDFMGFIQL